ncbi:MAG: NAD-dependent epimerase/dehydratase family protein [Gammaproteobacteria bacterium]|nr:NAD-dependent epimerase/dehydratase family protein [Gammaproteobacteria bacterium]
MRILVTGVQGFIGKNLCLRLTEQPEDFEVLRFERSSAPESLLGLVAQADVVIHLAGENRPQDPADFQRVNVGLTQALADAIRACGRSVAVLMASSIQAELDNPYGNSKRAAEDILRGLAADMGSPVVLYRLPNVFGKWCKPDYNSVVATFAHNIANELPIVIHDREKALRLVYVDDVIDAFLAALSALPKGCQTGTVAPEYEITLGALADQLHAFRLCRSTLVSERVGTGLTRALYSTYVSYLPVSQFAYTVPRHGDQRGVFVEMLKTQDSGQFSFFTAHPGVTRGGHYHHSKTEKFLVIKGQARFGFRHMLSGENFEILTSGEVSQIVETVPGWTHDITNIGSDELLVMLWANEIFDRARPDTIACKV